MKKIITTILLLAAFSATFAQPGDSTIYRLNSKHDFYVMQGEYLFHYYLAIQSDTVFNDIILRNGKILTSKAELANKDKILIFLNEGECIDSKGKISKCSQLKRRLIKSEKVDSKLIVLTR